MLKNRFMYNLKNLQYRIKYKFKNQKILLLSLTHRSYSNIHNERLEFLGDSVLNFLVTKKIYEKFSPESEGYMTRIRSNLVNGKNLLKIAKKLQLNKYILLGQGEIKMKGQYKKSILSNTVEAIIGAIFLDCKNTKIIENIINKLFFKKKKNFYLNKNKKDFKTLLQEYLQKYKLELPKYLIIKKEGKDHEKIFTVQCKININNKKKIAKGIGNNKKKAEQIAAKKILLQLKIKT